LVGRQEGAGPEGKFSNLTSVSYDPDAKAYTLYVLSSDGPGGGAKGTVTGNTWNWQRDGTFEGKPAKWRLTTVEVSPTSMTSKMERSVAGGPWTVTGEWKETKVK
jgi:hypothetical protein